MWTWGVWITFLVSIDDSDHIIHLVWWVILTSVIHMVLLYVLSEHVDSLTPWPMTSLRTCFQDAAPTCGWLFTWPYLLYWPLEWLEKTNYHWSFLNYRVNLKPFISCTIAYILYQLYHAFLHVNTLTCVYISVCVHINGLAQNCGSSSANTLELPRSCVWPWMLSVYVGACVFYLLCLHALFILQSDNSSSS